MCVESWKEREWNGGRDKRKKEGIRENNQYIAQSNEDLTNEDWERMVHCAC